MRARAEVVLRLSSPEAALAVSRALAPDNPGFAEAAVDGTTLTFRAGAESVPSLIRTLDDLLAAAGLAERLDRQASSR